MRGHHDCRGQRAAIAGVAADIEEAGKLYRVFNEAIQLHFDTAGELRSNIVGQRTFLI
jgi:hypothetical protein